MDDLADRDPELIWTEAGEPQSARYGDVYFSAQDGLAESRTVFLTGCDLPVAWARRPVFTVGELGFGSGLNIVALLDLWRRHRPEGGRLHVFTVEAHPLDPDQARRALSAWPEIAETAEALLARWPAPTPGFHRIDLPRIDAVVDVAIGDVAWALSQWGGRADAWFLDGFSPAKNPSMWSDPVFDLIAACSGPGTRVATFTVAGAVRRALAQRGFIVEKRPGHGRKRERLEAYLPGPGPVAHPAQPGSIIVIGAGIAGASVARALAAAGVEPVLIEAAGPGAAASGFPAALVTPRFDLGDEDVAALFAQALGRAEALYGGLPGAVIDQGVIQLPAMERDARRFAGIARQPIWGDGEMTLLNGCATAEAGDPIGGPALSMARAFVASPAAILSAWLPALAPGRAAGLEPCETGWRVVDSAGTSLVEARHVVLCAGAGNADLLPELALAPVRGQADWVEGPTTAAMAWGGYVAPTADGLLFGSTHDRGDTDTRVRPGDTAHNLASLSARLPGLAETVRPLPVRSHAAIRATTRDRLPIAGPVPGRPGLFVLGGLGSRGFCLAPLLGEHLVALILERPSPLSEQIAARITPARAALQTLAQPSEPGDA